MTRIYTRFFISFLFVTHLFTGLPLATTSLTAQKDFTLEEIWNGAFRTQYLYGYKMIHPDKMLRGEFEHGIYYIKLYDLKTWKPVKTVFSTEKFTEFRYVADYVYSGDLTYFLMASDVRPIYRYSKKGKYYLFDTRQNTLKIFSDDYIQIPRFLPDNKRVVYFKENNLYYKDLNSGEEIAITTDGEKNKIINGKTDWVYEEEFSFVKAYAVSRNGKYLAFLKFDESHVPEYHLTYYNGDLYPRIYTYKYPKAGQKNSTVGLYIYNFSTKRTRHIDLGDYEYIPYIKSGSKPGEFMLMTMNRRQNLLKLFSVDGETGRSHFIAKQQDDKYVDFERVNEIFWLDETRFLWTSEADGFNHIYLYRRKGGKPKQITKGKWEVTALYGFSPAQKRIYYQSTETGSINRAIFSVDFKGKHKNRLSPAEGWASADFSKDFKYFILQHSSTEKPPSYVLYKTPSRSRGKPVKIKDIINNKRLLDKLKDYRVIKKEFITFSSADDNYALNAYIYKPENFDQNEKYPVLIYQYNGPGAQTVRNAWGRYDDYYHQMLAQKGYIVLSVDTRGTGGRGAEFRKLTYKNLGKLELEDLRAVARQFKSLNYTGKIGIWGWSYGGFMSSNVIIKAGDLFDMAIAVAPVTNWRFYDTVYTERYMQTPEENSDGYDENSPLGFADRLSKPFLLVHGTADDNVHVQNTYELARKLQEEGKQFDMEIYPDKNHGIYGGRTRYQLYNKMYKFIKNNLKN